MTFLCDDISVGPASALIAPIKRMLATDRRAIDGFVFFPNAHIPSSSSLNIKTPKSERDGDRDSVSVAVG